MAFLHEDVTHEEKVLFLAALFHDIGKFWQRTGDTAIKSLIEKEYEVIYKEENAYAPRHQEWSAYFCEKFGLADVYKGINGMVRNHHNPSNRLEFIIWAADALSAGERQNKEDEKDARQLISIFSSIKLNNKGCEREYYKAVVPFSNLEFPEEDPKKNVVGDYRSLWKDFEENMAHVRNFTEAQELEKIYNLLEEYTSNVPSAFYYSKPDISLFAHLRTTAAVSSIIYRLTKDMNEPEVIEYCRKLRFGNVSNFCCLVKGDISGIQDFVYDTAMDGATKALRGKSFYISYMLNVVAKYILKKEKLPICNLLYSGGGHFYLLMPPDFINKIRDYQKELDDLMYEGFSGKLSILLEGVRVDSMELKTQDLSEKFEEVGRRLQEKKNKKFFNIMDEYDIFGPFEERGEICPYCGRSLEEKTNEEKVCSLCESFADLGESLISSEFILEKWGKLKKSEIRTWKDILERLGLHVIFSNKPASGFCYSIKMNSVDSIFRNSCGYIKIPSRMGRNENDNIITFDEISNSAKGIKLWGVLRGDVDNLGRIFKCGLGENSSLARIATLSQELSQFFGVYLEQYITSNYSNCYVIYAGGDDFFIVGRWDELPYLAYDIKKEFSKCTCHNPAITVSMAFTMPPDEKFPIYKVAGVAGDFLEEAKEYKRNGKEKDAFNFSGSVLGWEEFEKFKELKEKIVKTLEVNVSRALLSIIYDSCENWNMSLEKGEIFRSWRLLYRLTKLRERHEKEAGNLLDEIRTDLLDKGNRLYKYAFEAARWAEFETRK